MSRDPSRIPTGSTRDRGRRRAAVLTAALTLAGIGGTAAVAAHATSGSTTTPASQSTARTGTQAPGAIAPLVGAGGDGGAHASSGGS